MSPEEFKKLSTGDIVRHQHESRSVVVTENLGDHVTAVRTFELTNPHEWVLIFKAKQERVSDQ